MHTKYIDYLRYGLFIAGLTVALFLLSKDVNLQGNLLGILPDGTGNDDTQTADNNSFNMPLNGAILDLTTLSLEEIEPAIQTLDALGMHTIVIEKTRTHPNASSCQNGTYDWYEHMQEKLDMLFEKTKDSDMNIYIGVLSPEDMCGDLLTDKHILYGAQETSHMITYFNTVYNDYPSLAGYYVSSPVKDFYFEPDSKEYLFYENMAQAVHERSDKPVLTSIHLQDASRGNSANTPELAAEQVNVLFSTGIDIVIVNDDAALGTNLGWNHTPEPSIGQYYSAMAAVIAHEKLWTSHDIRNCCGLPDHASNVTQAAALTRINMQLKQSASMDSEVHLGSGNWLFTNTASSVYDAERLKAAFRAFYGNPSRFITPFGYRLITAPEKTQNDNNNKLTDGIVGDANSFALYRQNNQTTKEWVGFEGDVEMVIDLGRIYPIEWVGLHVLQKDNSDIGIPGTISLEVSQDSINWESAGSWDYPMESTNSGETMVNGEYMSGNLEPLSVSGRFIKVNLLNQKHTYISEIETIVGEENE